MSANDPSRRGVYTRIDRRLHKQLEKAAAKSQRSVSAEVAWRLEESIRLELKGVNVPPIATSA